MNALLFACAPLAFAQAAGTATPPALAAAQAQYRDTVAEDTKIYMAKLAQLKAQAAKTGDTALGDAVTKETAAIVAEQAAADAALHPVKQAAPETKKTPSVDELEASLVNTTWVWYGSETMKLLPHGKAQESTIPAPTMNWDILSSSPVVISGTDQVGNKYTMTLDDDLKSGTLKDGDTPLRITAKVTK